MKTQRPAWTDPRVLDGAAAAGRLALGLMALVFLAASGLSGFLAYWMVAVHLHVQEAQTLVAAAVFSSLSGLAAWIAWGAARYALGRGPDATR